MIDPVGYEKRKAKSRGSVRASDEEKGRERGGKRQCGWMCVCKRRKAGKDRWGAAATTARSEEYEVGMSDGRGSRGVEEVGCTAAEAQAEFARIIERREATLRPYTLALPLSTLPELLIIAAVAAILLFGHMSVSATSGNEESSISVLIQLFRVFFFLVAGALCFGPLILATLVAMYHRRFLLHLSSIEQGMVKKERKRRGRGGGGEGMVARRGEGREEEEEYSSTYVTDRVDYLLSDDEGRDGDDRAVWERRSDTEKGYSYTDTSTSGVLGQNGGMYAPASLLPPHSSSHTRGGYARGGVSSGGGRMRAMSVGVNSTTTALPVPHQSGAKKRRSARMEARRSEVEDGDGSSTAGTSWGELAERWRNEDEEGRSILTSSKVEERQRGGGEVTSQAGVKEERGEARLNTSEGDGLPSLSSPTSSFPSSPHSLTSNLLKSPAHITRALTPLHFDATHFDAKMGKPGEEDAASIAPTTSLSAGGVLPPPVKVGPNEDEKARNPPLSSPPFPLPTIAGGMEETSERYGGNSTSKNEERSGKNERGRKRGEGKIGGRRELPLVEDRVGMALMRSLASTAPQGITLFGLLMDAALIRRMAG
eukprot:CAMPEP_0113889250 /NCGR_PEP_ID=MMETSP0780_2-20120614/13373_1 /TAXON_ID=652834 /ORGANISM="Palpitomonas bilix" /LENGTH=594 /DNA_ID=CAMNT_0000878289 /DNA_START=489 /DNA_END=2270 /DNA_ORIENTATION=+ /assembly_acc=CAM_ASM_000599